MINKQTRVIECMTTNPVTLTPTDTMQAAHDLLQAHPFHHLPVVNTQGCLVGMVSFSDYMRVLRNIYDTPSEKKEDNRYLSTVLVQDVMTDGHRVIALDEQATLEDAFRLMKANKFHALPIIGKNNALKGIITVYDLLKLLGDHFLKIT